MTRTLGTHFVVGFTPGSPETPNGDHPVEARRTAPIPRSANYQAGARQPGNGRIAGMNIVLQFGTLVLLSQLQELTRDRKLKLPVVELPCDLER